MFVKTGAGVNVRLPVFFVWPRPLRQPGKDSFFTLFIYTLSINLANLESGCLSRSSSLTCTHTCLYRTYTLVLSHTHTHRHAHAHAVSAPFPPSLQTVVNKSQGEKTLSAQKGKKKEKCYMTAVPLGGGEGGRKRLDESRGGDAGEEWGREGRGRMGVG